ncbi:capon-like protein isoform X3 [Sitophilus oryzae]|uniref:Capon-like protein isoform X3 n=1 Tax=Sitophilus oryzae TaxID=7048 RepID=A0A6J2YCL6_SITOR|nr:capon-like protein isoform X3 [Sitophilus oryzae]
MAQLQLAREQLQAEQTARMEAQARTHQLLVHNRELLDHIAALVAHLQGGEKTGQQSSQPQMTMPQLQHLNDLHSQETSQMDVNLMLQALGLNPSILENRTATSCQSPLRTTFNPGGSSGAGNIFNFPYPQAPVPLDTSYENQILQRLQAYGAFPPISPPYHLNLPQTMPLMSQGYYGPQGLMSNNFSPSSYATLPRYAPNIERISPSRNSEPRQIPQNYSGLDLNQNLNQTQQGFEKKSNYSGLTVPQIQRRHSSINLAQEGNQNLQSMPSTSQYQFNSNPIDQNTKTSQNFQSIPSSSQYQFNSSPMDQNNKTSDNSQSKDDYLIKPLSQLGTLTTTDSEGRVRVIVPVPSNTSEEERDLLTNLRISEDLRLINGPGISRSASERVPNRSELMSQVQRTMWARHTTK